MKSFKNESKHGPAVPFSGPHAQLSQRSKENFTVPFFGPSAGPKMRPQIAKSTPKVDSCNKQKNITAFI
jgi:hypothetical protein